MTTKFSKTLFRKRMFTTILRIVAVLVIAFPVSGSAYANGEPHVEIRWFVGLGTGTDPAQLPAQQKAVDDFNDSHPGIIHITLEIVNSGEARQVLAQEIADGNAPDLVGPVGWAGANAFHDQWMDLEPLITFTGYDTSIFDAQMYEMYQTDIGQEGLPFALYPSAIYYNPALFDAAGLNYPPDSYGEQYEMPGGDFVDWNWDTVAEVSRLLTLDSGGKNSTEDGFNPNDIVQYGFSFGWENHPNYWGSFWQSGSMVQGTDPYTASAPDAWKDAWRWMYDGMWGEQPFVPAGEAYNNFGGNPLDSGTVAMVDIPSWYLCCLGNLTGNGGTFQFAAMPTYNEEVGGRIDADTFRILKTTEHPEEAFEVLTYLVGPAVDTLLIGSEAIPPAYSGIPGLTDKQDDFVAAQSVQYSFVSEESWEVLLDGLNYPDIPSAEGWMPYWDEAWNRGYGFIDLLQWNDRINIDYEIACYEKSLQAIFNGQPFAEPWRDEFMEPPSCLWNWVNENPEKWEIADGFLRIYTSPYGSGGENLLLRPVAEGDFSIETRVLFTPDTNFQIAGLVIWQGEGNFLQFGRAYCDIEGPCVGNGIYFDKVLGGSGVDSNFATQIDNPFNPAEAYLRLERRGDMVRALYSHEGITWIEIGSHQLPEGFQVTGVGLTSAQDFYTEEQDVPADFDYFELTEGWGFLPEGYHDYDSGNVPSWACNAGGWAADPDDRAADLAIEVGIDGTPLPDWLYASEYREDLDDAGVCEDGYCSFSTSLWDKVAIYEPHSVVVYAQDIPSGDWVQLSNSPKELTCRSYDIYTYDPLTGTTKQITGLEGTDLRQTGEYDPTWSPNGKLVAHDVTTNNSHQIHITDVKTGVSKVLHGTEDGGNDAAWSPNGKWIAFDRRWFDNDQNIYIVPATGGIRILAVQNAVTASWAPSGKRIAFQSSMDHSIRTAPVDGGKGGVTTIADYGETPAWSPDGNWIAYNEDGDIWKVQVNVQGKVLGVPIQLTSGPSQDGKPTWTPDSQTIIYDSNFGQDSDLLSIPATGGTPTWLTGAPVYGDYGPANARNSSNVAYASFSPPEPATITIWHQWAGEYLEAITNAFNRYMYEHPDVRINLYRPDDINGALAEAIPAGVGPDIIAWYNSEIGVYAQDGYIAALNDYGVDMTFLEETYEPAAVAGVVWQGKIWGLPESQDNITLVYNKAIASENDFPSDPLDFADLLAKAQAYYDTNGIPLFCNQAFPGGDAYHIAPLFFGFDSAFPFYVDDQGNVYVNTPEKVAAGSWLISFKPYLLPEMSYDICRDAFITGQVAASWTGPWAIADLEANGVDYGFVTMGRPFVGIKTLMLSSNALDRGKSEVALDIMKFFTGYAMQKNMALANKTVPANTAALHDPEVQALPTIAGFGNNASIGVPMANTPYAVFQWAPMGDAVTAIWNGSLTPAVALAAAQAAIEEAIAAMNP